MSKMYQFRYRVTGRVAFPIDMLRYDQSFPASEIDSGKIDRALHHDFKDGEEIELTTWTENRKWSPTERRWESFLWKVIPGSVEIRNY